MNSLKAKCLLCKRKIDIGIFTGTYSLHNNKAGEVCPGSSREIPKDLILQVKPPANKTKSKQRARSAEPSGSLFAQFEVNQKLTINKSLREEREIRRANLEEKSSLNSARSINSGLPTLGKR